MLAFTAHVPWNPEEDESFAVGDHEVEEPSEELIHLAAAAHAAGAISVTEGLDESTLDSPEEPERKLAEAMGNWVEPERLEDGTTKPGYWDGPWYEGHMAAQKTSALHGQGFAEAVIDVEPAPEVVEEDEEV